MRGCGVIVIAIGFLAPGVALGQERLEQIRRDANQNPGSSNSSCSSDSSLPPEFDKLADTAWYLVALSPFYVPHALMQDDLSNACCFPWHPYPPGATHASDDLPSYLWCGPKPDLGTAWRSPKENWGATVLVEDGNDFRGLNRAGLRATFDTSTRFGLQSNWNFLSEYLTNRGHDATVLGDTSFTYRFAQCGQAQMHTGLGFRVLTDQHTTNWGFNFLYGLDYFPVKPIVVSALFDTGTIGSAGVVHFRTTVGANYRHLECLTGYDFMRIGSVNVQGPLIGLRFWF